MVALIVNFVLLLALLIYFGRKPIGKALGDRHDRVKQALDEAEQLRASVEAMVRDYEAKLAGFDAEIARILKEAREAGERERERILKRAEEGALRIREEAERRAEKETQRARAELEAEALSQAVERAMELLKSRVKEGDHKIFTEELITHLEKAHGQRH